MPHIDGHTEPGWETVADRFQRNFKEANELGAAVAVYVDGSPVVDLWGGTANSRSNAPWEGDTSVVTFSTTKGVTAMCAHLLVERGELDLDAPVSRYWPEFSGGGKESVPVRWLLSHRSGLAYLDEDLSFDQLRAHEPVIRALEAQRPHWDPGTAFAYHAILFGHLVGELVARITGRSLGTFFAEEIAGPLGLQSWIGLPIDEELSLAHVEREPTPDPPAMVAALTGPDSRWARAITFGGALPFELIADRPGDFNDRRLLAVELGGSNMVSDARSIARVYASCVGEVDGVRLLSAETISAATEIQTRDIPYFGWPQELAAIRPMEFALGFMAHPNPIGPGSFGHGGAGGSLGMGDLDHRVGFGYVMNRMDATTPDTRATSLIDAVRSCLS